MPATLSTTSRCMVQADPPGLVTLWGDAPKPGPKSFSALLGESFQTALSLSGVSVCLLALGQVPGLLLAGPAGSGLNAQAPLHALAYAVEAGAEGLALLAVLTALAAAADGIRLDVFGAFREALGHALPLLLAELRAALWIFGGFLLFVVPGVIFSIRYPLVHLAVLIERREGRAALDRSSALIDRHGGKALGYPLLAALIMALAGAVGAFLVAMTFGFLFSDAPGAAAHWRNQAYAFMLELVDSLIWTVWTAFTVFLYKDLALRTPLKS